MQSNPSPSIQHLYAHIPFCPRKCGYCAFVNHVGSLKLLPRYLEALQLEARHIAMEHPGGPLHTVYFGGGTPSMMAPGQIRELLECFGALLGLKSGAEITLEGHPLTVDAQKLVGFREAGITRLSFGAESMQPNELQALGREHTGGDIRRVLQESRSAGFRDINLDFMYGIPLQTPSSWRETLERTLDLRPDHLSLYPLQIEPRTVFGRKRRENTLVVPEDDMVVEMYHLASDLLRGAGFEHYEVANWAQPGHRSHHNLAYWHNREFYAVGVGAHGYLHPHRTENIRQTKRYIDTVFAGERPVAATTKVDECATFTESVMLGLRLLQDGISIAEVRDRFGIDLRERFAADLEELLGAELVRLEGGRLWLDERAVPLANEVWERFVLT